MSDTIRKYYNGTRYGNLHVEVDRDAGTSTLLDAKLKPVLRLNSVEKEDLYKAISTAKQYIKAKTRLDDLEIKIYDGAKLPENYYFPSSNVSDAKKNKPRR